MELYIKSLFANKEVALVAINGKKVVQFNFQILCSKFAAMYDMSRLSL